MQVQKSKAVHATETSTTGIFKCCEFSACSYICTELKTWLDIPPISPMRPGNLLGLQEKTVKNCFRDHYFFNVTGEKNYHKNEQRSIPVNSDDYTVFHRC